MTTTLSYLQAEQRRLQAEIDRLCQSRKVLEQKIAEKEAILNSIDKEIERMKGASNVRSN